MEIRQVKLLHVTMGQILNLIKSLNINESSIYTHSEKLKIVKKKVEEYMILYKDQEHLKILSPEEQRVLSQNTKNFYDVYQKLEKEIEYLQMTKYPQFISNAINVMESGHTQLEYFYTEIIGICGDIVMPHLSTIKLKHWPGGLYKQKVINLSIELEAQLHDFYKDHIEHYEASSKNIFLIPIYLQFAEAFVWLQKEEERLKTEGMPEITQIDLPEEVFPKIPDSPPDKKETANVK